MRKDGGGKLLSPVIRAKPSLSPEDDNESSPSAEIGCDSSSGEPSLSEKDKVCVKLADSISNGFCKEDGDNVKASVDAVDKNDSSSPADAVDTADAGASASLQENGTVPAIGCDSSKVECSSESEVRSDVVQTGTSSSASCNEAGGSSADGEPCPSSSTSEVWKACF